MVNISKFYKSLNRKMNKAVKSITILKRTGSSDSSIGTNTKELLGEGPNISREDNASRSNEAMFNMSQTNTKENFELSDNLADSGSNEEILDLSQKVTKEEIEIQSKHEVLFSGQNVIKENIKLSERSEIELDLIKHYTKELQSTKSNKDVMDLSQNGTKKEAKSSGSNEEILDLSQKMSKEKINSGSNHEVLDFSPYVTQEVDFKLSEWCDIEGSKVNIEMTGSIEYVRNITEEDINLPLEVDKITILKRSPSCIGVTKNRDTSSGPLETTNAENDGGGKFCEEHASDKILSRAMSSRSVSGERKLQQDELKVSREVMMKEETLVKPVTILKRPENASNSNLIKDKLDTLYTSTIHIEPIEQTHIDNNNAKPSESTGNIENAGVLENEETKEEEEEEPVQNFTILKRPEITNVMFENKLAAQLIKTLDQRKQDYDKARIRIFGEPGSYEEVTSEDSPPLEQTNSSDVGAVPHVNEITPGTPEHSIEIPTEPLENYDDISSNTLVPCKEIPNHCSGIYKMSRNELDIYNEIPADSSDLPSGIQNELVSLRSNGSQHPLHYYNQHLPNFQPFYNDVNATSAYYCSGFDYNTQYGPFWSEGDTSYPPTNTEVPYGPPFNGSGTNFFLPSEELYHTYFNGYHVPDGVNDFSYDVHINDYSSYDLSFTDFESTGVST